MFSGKFLCGYNFDIQLKIHAELDEKCPERTKVKCPLFEEMMWYVLPSLWLSSNLVIVFACLTVVSRYVAEDYVRMMHEKTHVFNQAELDGTCSSWS